MKQRKNRRSQTRSPSIPDDVVDPLDHSLHYTLRAAVDFMEGLGSPRALAVALMIRYGEYDQLIALSCDPMHYQHAADFNRDYAATRYIAKLQGLRPKTLLVEKALSSFKAAEDRCASTNLRIMNGLTLTGIDALIERIRGKINFVLGECNLQEVLSLCRWGPGATATLKGDSVRPEEKILEQRLSVTRQLFPLASIVVGFDLHWCRARLGTDVEGPCSLLAAEFQWVDYMRVVTVDKDSKTDRTIGAEPTLNTYVQQGIGRYIRQRLRRVGVDLDDQRINQSWAELALELGLATVDLSSASDLISYWLVELLLPPAWFQLLDKARSGYAKMPDGTVVPLEKFSSMGNGFTFELETLIFWATAKAVVEEVGACSELVSVYGDDIILPAPAYSRLCDVFQVFGFRVNADKSYATGLFYESCGEHFFNGMRVTPVYQKDLLDGLPEYVRAANRLCRWADPRSNPVVVDDRIAVCRLSLLKLGEIICRGKTLPTVPWGTEGDDGFWVLRQRGYYDVNRGHLCTIVRLIPRKEETTSFEAILAVNMARSGSAPSPSVADVYRSTGQMLALVDKVQAASVVIDTSFGGKVTLRGDRGYRLARRWVKT